MDNLTEVIRARVTEDLKKSVTQYAARKSMSESDVVRQAVIEFFEGRMRENV